MALPGLSLDSWNQVMAVNAAGVFLGTKSVHAAMKRAGGGSIINISSICGIVGSFGNAAYNASAVRVHADLATHREQRAAGAMWPFSGADVLAEGDQPLVDLHPIVLWHHSPQRDLRALGR